MKSILIFLFTFSFLTSCSKKESEMPLLGDNISAQNMIGNWKLKSFSNKAAIPYEVTLEIKEEEGKFVLNGRSSVNFYFAALSVNESNKTLKISDVGSTKMAGTTEANQFESKYFQYLSTATKYSFQDSNTLIFYMAKPAGETMIFEKK